MRTLYASLILSYALLFSTLAPAQSGEGLLFAGRASVPNSGRLTTPEGLSKDVKFWERIFAEYRPEECVFHDERHLEAVYYVAPVPRLVKAGGSPLLKRHVKAIRAALNNIKSRGAPSGTFERSIYQAVPERLRTSEFFAAAADRVRCQRGVEFDKSLAKSRPYVDMIKRTLREKGLPEDLAYLPHLESGFDRFATSKVGAKGLWQFMPHTARAEGLIVKRKNDWRTDPARSTDAATDHLASIFLRTQSWELAITAYNYGENGVMRAIQKFGPDYMKIRAEHKTRMFGFAARNYYPSFLAVRNVAMREETRLASAAQDGRSVADGDDKAAGGTLTF